MTMTNFGCWQEFHFLSRQLPPPPSLGPHHCRNFYFADKQVGVYSNK
jgi:hypothetical protein